MENMKFIKYPEIQLLPYLPQLLDREVYVTEKLDGGNCQFRKIDGRVRCGNRANFIESKLFDREWFPDFRKWVTSNYSLYNIPESLIFFGEWLSGGEIQYRPENMNKFYLIDILNLEDKRFIDYKRSTDIAEKLELKDMNLLRILREGKVKEGELKSLMKKSGYYDGPMEGLVVKDYQNQLFAKIHSPFYEETLSDRRLPLEERYITERKIKKSLSCLKEGGEKFGYSDLVGYLRRNINEEYDILISEKKIQNRIKKVLDKKEIGRFLASYSFVKKNEEKLKRRDIRNFY